MKGDRRTVAERWTVNSFQTNDNAAMGTTQRTGGWTDGAGAGPAEGEDRRGNRVGLRWDQLGLGFQEGGRAFRVMGTS